MKFLIVLGFLLGFGAVMAAAGLAPVAVQERIPSRTTVANNGGRLETFVIRLPADRIASTGRLDQAIAVIDPVTGVEPPAALADGEFVIEQFKLRNTDGDVIGVAVRHWTTADGTSASAWLISIPSRGALVWTADGDTPGMLSAAIASAGFRPGVAWQGDVTVPIAADGRSGRIAAGTEEFEGSTGVVAETWDITGVGRNGELRGTISLDTRVSRTQ